MSLASQIMNNGSINQELLDNITPVLTKMGLGHFLIKSPDNYVGLEIQFDETRLNKFFKMKNGEFISVPNDPQYYRDGSYSEFDSNPLIAAAKIEGTDLWGVNRRNVIFHDVVKSTKGSLLNIWASYDDGSLLDKNEGKGGPDNIRFLDDQIINGKDLPIIPKMTKIGEINLLNLNIADNLQTTIKRDY